MSSARPRLDEPQRLSDWMCHCRSFHLTGTRTASVSGRLIAVAAPVIERHGRGDRDQCQECQHGAGCVRVFPLPARRLEMVRRDGPVIAGDVHRIGEHPEDDLRGDQAEKGASDRRRTDALTTAHYGVQQRQQHGGEAHNAEQGPSSCRSSARSCSRSATAPSCAGSSNRCAPVGTR